MRRPHVLSIVAPYGRPLPESSFARSTFASILASDGIAYKGGRKYVDSYSTFDDFVDERCTLCPFFVKR